MKSKIVMLVLLLTSLCSCHTGNSVPILTATTHPTPTDIPRWQLYETALLEATIKREDGLCEWVILGISGNEVYVYTLCQATGRIKTAASVPAVIYLSESGEEEVLGSSACQTISMTCCSLSGMGDGSAGVDDGAGRQLVSLPFDIPTHQMKK